MIVNTFKLWFTFTIFPKSDIRVVPSKLLVFGASEIPISAQASLPSHSNQAPPHRTQGGSSQSGNKASFPRPRHKAKQPFLPFNAAFFCLLPRHSHQNNQQYRLFFLFLVSPTDSIPFAPSPLFTGTDLFFFIFSCFLFAWPRNQSPQPSLSLAALLQLQLV